ncbi:hypothetical protein J7L48_05375 [bacterium]|nr:hypothetical protein [bacterium]
MKKFLIAFFFVGIFFTGCNVYMVQPRQNPKIIIHEKPNLLLVIGYKNVFHAKRYAGNLLFFDGRWYYFENDAWYISQYWKGPFVYVKVVPAKIANAHKKMKIKTKRKGKKNNGNVRGNKKGKKW